MVVCQTYEGNKDVCANNFEGWISGDFSKSVGEGGTVVPRPAARGVGGGRGRLCACLSHAGLAHQQITRRSMQSVTSEVAGAQMIRVMHIMERHLPMRAVCALLATLRGFARQIRGRLRAFPCLPSPECKALQRFRKHVTLRTFPYRRRTNGKRPASW
jgi:hypothetical protein